MKAFKPADLICVAVYPIGHEPKREIVYRERYRWRWIANMNRNALGWDYDNHLLLIFKVVDVDSKELY